MVQAKSAHPPREVRSAVRSEHILDAAANLFAERGFHRTTTRDIAEAADVAEGTLYNYFASKDDLLMGIMRKLSASLDTSDGKGPSHPGDAREYLHSLMHNRAGFMKENTAMLQALLSEILANAELRERYYHQIMEPTIVSLENSLELRRTLGQVSVSDVPGTARLIAGIIIGLFFLKVLGDPLVNSTAGTLDDRIVELIFDGIGLQSGDHS